ncbi:MAG: hypothetical protein JWO06_1374 [Bacteroidota bacterium]|nr:hypothetical protein [Bacteroidota bacterium]
MEKQAWILISEMFCFLERRCSIVRLRLLSQRDMVGVIGEEDFFGGVFASVVKYPAQMIGIVYSDRQVPVLPLALLLVVVWYTYTSAIVLSVTVYTFTVASAWLVAARPTVSSGRM